MIVIRHDKFAIGRGSLHGCVIVTCRDCGAQKYIWELTQDQRKQVRKQLTKQGFKDERTGFSVRYDWELEATA